MNILITGSKGFIGSYLTQHLKKEGHNITSFDLIEGKDICDKRYFDTIQTNIDVVVHLASKTFVPDSYEKPHVYFNVNTNGTLNVLEFCRLNQVGLIFFSSYVYGVPQYFPINEEHPIDAFNPYAASKIVAEDLCRYYNKFWGIPITIFRPFNIYGYGQNKSFLLPQIITQALSGSIKVKDLSPKRDFIYVDDIVKAISAACENIPTSFKIYNLGTGESHSVSEIVDRIKYHFPNVEVIKEEQKRKNEIQDTIADISLVKNELGWSPDINFTEGIDRMITIYKSQMQK